MCAAHESPRAPVRPTNAGMMILEIPDMKVDPPTPSAGASAAACHDATPDCMPPPIRRCKCCRLS